eukprot:GEMP01021131.1.p1 GENE.GEMP01021131.1~~GEMP01021131.1.p1  ORF type:complete len:639 (+),score=169.61 GEMP01021131.1:53-1969(+)
MAYLLICAMDLDVPQCVEGSVEVLLDGRLALTSPIPSTMENHIILPLGCGTQVTLRCTSGSADYGNATLFVKDFSLEARDEWIALDDSNRRLRIMTKYVSEEIAFEECDVDRTFAAQDFLILGLQSLNQELDQQKTAKSAPTFVSPPTRLIKPKAAPKRLPIRSPPDRLAGGRKAEKEANAHDFDDLAWEKTEPYRNIITVLEQNLASLETVDADRRDAQEQLQDTLAENHLLSSKLSELSELKSSLEEKEAEVEAKWVQQLRTEEIQKNEVTRELQVVQGMLDATVANRDAAVRQAEARVDDMKSEIARLREELLEVHETTAERYRTLESDLRGRSAAMTVLNDENEDRQAEWRKELQSEKDAVASLLVDKEAVLLERDVLQGRITTLEEDLCAKGVNQSRLSEARNETRRKQAELDREVAKGEEYRKTMERLVAREQGYSRKFEKREKEMREELDRQAELARQQEALNHTLTGDSHEMAQSMAIMEQRLKLNSGLEDRFVGKNADLRLLQTEQVELQQQFANEMRLRAIDQDRLLALEERNAVLAAEVASAQQISAGGAASSTGYCESLQEELEDAREELDEQKRENAHLRQDLDGRTYSTSISPSNRGTRRACHVIILKMPDPFPRIFGDRFYKP